jgi:hypothetical protein
MLQHDEAQSASRPVANMAPQPQIGLFAGIDFNQPLDPNVTKTWQNAKRVQNKENTQPPRRLIDPHPQATKDTWDSQDDLLPPSGVVSKLKRAHPSTTHAQATFEEEEESQDEGFQADQRQIDPSRRILTFPSANPAKRHRQEGPELVPSSARHADIVDNLPVEQIAQSQARVITQHVGLSQRKVQVRRPWSRHDEELLIRYIGEHGCSWSFIAKLPGWDLMRDNMQVDLKDKARNLKVAILKYVPFRNVYFTNVD